MLQGDPDPIGIELMWPTFHIAVLVVVRAILSVFCRAHTHKDVAEALESQLSDAIAQINWLSIMPHSHRLNGEQINGISQAHITSGENMPKASGPIRWSMNANDFKLALKPFIQRKWKLTEATLAYEGGFLIIDAGPVHTVSHASGEWIGRVRFDLAILIALAKVPPAGENISLAFAENRLIIGGVTVSASWYGGAETFIQRATEPTLIDYLAMEQGLTMAQLSEPELAKQIADAKKSATSLIKRTGKQLAALDISEAVLTALVQRKVAERLG